MSLNLVSSRQGSAAWVPIRDSWQWFAIQTRSRHEKKVALHLEGKNIRYYLPLARTVHQWSDRRKQVEMPLFSGYAFVQLRDPWEHRLDILRIPGVVRIVGTRAEPAPIPEAQIEGIRRILSQGVNAEPYPYVRVGQRVRVRGGCLDGVEGILTSHQNRTLVVSVDTIQRSIAIRAQDYDLVAA